ncbi:unnamed protein product [Rotaria socialis]|uniref:Uncharacterized protein n=1 Tax=Rotaria socialis TaxID=392032 RepID=A0A818CTL4_9BILA|nr:unnamed protein product [Rotaria socialis]CAF3451426.1 unnamed protein product [Rotaria socialis]CAF3576383.1 unnamed protein product [Rotaria socialis]CAF3752140.1 unnamed protein product [Rotaria socialis]CAF4140132.1 unnamed protein product [Rotaria socialis]
MTSNSLNIPTNSSNFWSDRGYRKRKIDVIDCEEKSQHKIFFTEEKLIENMQLLSLDLSENRSISNSDNSKTDDEKSINQNEPDNLSEKETRFEIHKLFKNNLIRNNLQDSLINKLCDYERKKMSMQIVPYMPIHSIQSNNNNNNNISNTNVDEQEKKQENQNLSFGKVKEPEDRVFKRPLPPTSYTVEEPAENTTKRIPKMKRSYSQSMRFNSNLSVVELKPDRNDYSFQHSQTDYFVVEPCTPVAIDSTSSCLKPTSQTNQSSVQISEYFDFSSLSASTNNPFTSFNGNSFNMESIILTDIDDKMDDDI